MQQTLSASRLTWPRRPTRGVWFGTLLLTMALASPALADCREAPEPIVKLDFKSRYAEDSADKSEIDPDAAKEVEDALAPVEDFLRDLAEDATKAARDKDAEAAGCVIGQIAVWAREDALSVLNSQTAQLTIAARIASFGLIFRQMVDIAAPKWPVVPSDAVPDGETLAADITDVGAWLDRRVIDQISFWELDAPEGASTGNLRAWAALAAAARSSDQSGAHALRFALWSGAAASFVLCSANEDGSLPREMERGKRALQYQLHALGPLTVTALLLQEQRIPLARVCDNALDRAVGFALGDLDDGEATLAITGKVQTFFDGSQTLEAFHIAWIAAYLELKDAAHKSAASDLAGQFGSLSYSKLGGDQTTMWGP